MDFKKLSMNNKAVSPVIGVILMVAITVILAAAIGSTVFGEGTANTPQANFNIEAGKAGVTDTATIKVEHLGGDPIHFESDSITKVVASYEDKSYVMDADNTTTGLGTMGVGDTKTLTLVGIDSNNSLPEIKSGDILNIKFIDVETSQIICDKDIRF